MNRCSRTCSLMVALIFATVLAASSPLPAAAQEVHAFQVAAPDAASAIRAFGAQSGLQILASGDDLSGKKLNPVNGEISTEQALDVLLAGTGFDHRYVGEHAVALILADNSGSSAAAVTKEPPEKRHFRIPSGSLDEALKAFSAQSGVAVVAAAEITAEQKTKGARGTMTASDALRRVLKESGLKFVWNANGSVTIQARPKIAAADLEGPVSADVSVQSQRDTQVYTPGGNVDIPRTVDDVQPYYIFDSETITNSGVTSVEDFLRQRLSMNAVYQSNSQVYGSPLNNNPGQPAGGTTSSINLRGLGANETLILVDGRRMAGVSISGETGQPDVNGIPLAAIDRIEVLPSSASGIYGGSALGGVVNIILKKDYTGGEFRYMFENVMQGSAPASTLDGSYGAALEGGATHVMLSLHYSTAQPLLVQDRKDLVESGINNILENDPAAILQAGSPFLGGTLPNISNGISFGPNGPYVPNLTLVNGTVLPSPITTLCPGISPSTPTATLDACLAKNAGHYSLGLSPGLGEFGLQQPIGYVPTVKSALATIRREFTSSIDAFVEVAAEENSGRSAYNPIADYSLPVYPGVATYPGVPANPANPFQSLVEVHIPSNVSAPLLGGGGGSHITTGVTAKLAHDWSGELDYTWSENRFSSFSYQASYFALENDPYVPALPGPLGALLTGALNPLVDTSLYPIDARRYLAPASYASSSTLNDVALRLTGPLIHLPWGSPSLALALEHREEGFPTNTQAQAQPAPFQPYDTYTTFFGQHESTNSVYAEFTLPLVTQQNALPGVRGLEVQLADRVERYSVLTGTSFVTSTPGLAPFLPSAAAPFYAPSLDAAGLIPVPRATASYQSNNGTFGLKYRPIDDLTIRASHATAFLPPNYQQLLPNPEIIPDGDTITDPKTGLTYPVNITSGGNPNLKPQRSKDWDVGLIYQPQQPVLKGLRADLEYHKITQFDAIIDPQFFGDLILNNPSLAGRVTRSPTTGLVTLINESAINANEFIHSGWDATLDYPWQTSIGTFNAHAAVTLTEHNTLNLVPGGSSQEQVGEILALKTVANGTLTWAYKQWKLGWTTRWIDSYQSNFGSSGPEPSGPNSLRIPAQTYHDAVATYAFNARPGNLASNLTLQLGIKDVFNSVPPFDPEFAPFYRSPLGDIQLRRYWLAFRKDF